MASRRLRAALLLIVFSISAFVAHAQFRRNRWSAFEHEMQDPVDDPAGSTDKTEFILGRLRFRSPRDGRGPYFRWGIDANKCDRQFIVGLERLTRIDARSIEEIIDVEEDKIFDYPYLFAVSVGDWRLTAEHAQRLRKYFDRGGFMMVDDFHGEPEWNNFMLGIRQIFPDAEVVEMEDNHPAFHVVYDLTKRVQIPGANVVHGPGYERGGVTPHWRAVVDGKGRMMIAACFNMDVGDAWEFADDPGYPERFASEAYRLGVNYVLYSMTH